MKHKRHSLIIKQDKCLFFFFLHFFCLMHMLIQKSDNECPKKLLIISNGVKGAAVFRSKTIFREITNVLIGLDSYTILIIFNLFGLFFLYFISLCINCLIKQFCLYSILFYHITLEGRQGTPQMNSQQPLSILSCFLP